MSPNTEILSIAIPTKVVAELKRRAKAMDIAKSTYCKLVLMQWLASGKKLTLSE